MERMLDTHQLEAALKLLQDKGYGSRFAELTRPEAFEEALSDTLADTYLEVDRLTPEPKVTVLMGLRYDYHNLKVMLKSKHTGRGAESLWLALGSIPLQKMKRDLDACDLRDFPEKMRTAIETVQAKLEQTQDPLWIDLILDKACYQHLLETAKIFESPMIESYVNRRIDLINLLTWMRCQTKPKGKERLAESWLEGGTLDRELFLKSVNEPLDAMLQKLSHLDYAPLLRKCAESFQDSQRMVCVEKQGDELILTELMGAKRISFGPEPLLAYLVAKETEIQNLRILLLGLQSHLKPERIRERLRMLYV
jgi:V/A-type H+-transporting ATPase subunit C